MAKKAKSVRISKAQKAKKQKGRGYNVVNVVFNNNYSGVRYSYKIPEDASVSVGAKVIVDSPYGGETVVTVVSVHPGEYLDKMAELSYKWIVSVVDRADYARRTAQDKKRALFEKQSAVVRAEIEALAIIDSEDPVCATLTKALSK